VTFDRTTSRDTLRLSQKTAPSASPVSEKPSQGVAGYVAARKTRWWFCAKSRCLNTANDRKGELNWNSFNFVERDLSAGVVVELGRLGRFVVGDGCQPLTWVGQLAELVANADPLGCGSTAFQTIADDPMSCRLPWVPMRP
jgi:hypothetical protein